MDLHLSVITTQNRNWLIMNRKAPVQQLQCNYWYYFKEFRHMHSWWTISENNIDVMGFKPLCVWVSDYKYLFILAPSMKKTEWVMFAFNACIVCVYVCMCVCVGERERERDMFNPSPPGQHYDDVIMTMLASHITSLTVVYSIVYLGADQRKHQSSASLAFVRGKCFHLMTSSWDDRHFTDKQRVLMHRHQGLNVRHGLCHIYMRYLYVYELFIAFVCFVVCSLL